ncbi:DUF1385 domain-containing protein [bacterium]|nr:DUF1385 domain-containing protein [bacterium]
MKPNRLLRHLLPAFLAPAIPYGGQACIEGVMMKGLKHAALAVRRASGKIEVIDREVVSRFPALTRMPFIRGFFILWDMMTLGTWALKESNRRFEIDMLAADAEAKGEKVEHKEAAAPSKGSVMLEAIMMVVGFAIAIMIFKVLPAIAASYTFEWFGWGNLKTIENPTLTHQLVANLVEGLVKLGIFVGYISLVGRLKEIRRVFEYHGAEHIVINAYEDDMENQKMEFIQSHSVAHPRCGTSFIVILILVGVVLYTFLDYLFVSNAAAINASLPEWWMNSILGPAVHDNIPGWWIRWPLRILAIPILAGISYEFIRAAFRYYGNPFLRPLLRFGMLFQALTTRRPSDEQVEVSLASFNRVRYLTEDIPEPEIRQPASSASS